MAKLKPTSAFLSGSGDAYVPACMWRSKQHSSPWHGANQDYYCNNSSHRRVTNRTIFFVRGRIFWAFDILPAVEGSSVDSNKAISRGITREPAPFQFRVRSRHPEVERIIESESADADLRLKEWEY